MIILIDNIMEFNTKLSDVIVNDKGKVVLE